MIKSRRYSANEATEYVKKGIMEGWNNGIMGKNQNP
jgi:hypothetical protein